MRDSNYNHLINLPRDTFRLLQYVTLYSSHHCYQYSLEPHHYYYYYYMLHTHHHVYIPSSLLPKYSITTISNTFQQHNYTIIPTPTPLLLQFLHCKPPINPCPPELTPNFVYRNKIFFNENETSCEGEGETPSLHVIGK